MNDSTASRTPGLLPAPILVVLIMLLAILAAQWRPSEAQEGVTYDNLCLEDAYVGRVNCTASDFGITRIEFMNVTEPCRFPGDTAKVRLLLSAAVGSPERYDIAYFLALDGKNALDSGNVCYHSFLQPVSIDSNLTYSPTSGFGPFWQGDEAKPDFCGDSQGSGNDINVVAPNSITVATPTEIEVLCQDSPDDPDNQVDIKVCGSYKQANDSYCADVTGAVSGTPSKCSCTLFNLPFEPTGIAAVETTASPGLKPWLSVIALILVFSLSASTIAALLFRRVQDHEPK